jgi:hypothetical protein
MVCTEISTILQLILIRTLGSSTADGIVPNTTEVDKKLRDADFLWGIDGISGLANLIRQFSFKVIQHSLLLSDISYQFHGNMN